MSEEPGGNPLAEGAGDTTQKAVAFALLIAEALKQAKRVREEQRALAVAQTPDEKQRRQAWLAQAHDQASPQWRAVRSDAADPANPLFVAGKSRAEDPMVPLASLPERERVNPSVEAARLFASAAPFDHLDPDARRAVEIVEKRLTALQPELMAEYRERMAGQRLEAFSLAVAHHPAIHDQDQVLEQHGLERDPRAQAQAEAALTIGQDERQEAMTLAARPDLPQTPQNERTESLSRAEDHQELSDASIARAANHASQAQPFDIKQRVAAGTASPTIRSTPGRTNTPTQRPTRGRR